ncbi:unnamed protein product [Closterium sp. NIES-53]
MASLRVLAFDHEGRPVQFDTWLDDLQLYLLSNSKDSVSLFDLALGAIPAPPATADSATRSQWLTRDAAARLAIHNHLPLAECTHIGQHRTAQALYAAVVARYSLPAIAALGRLLLPYLFPELSAFASEEDLVSHLRTSDARYRATVPAEFLDRNQALMFITLYFIVTYLPESLRSVRDHFLSLDPTSLTVDLLEQHLLVAETSDVAAGAACGTPRPPFFKGTSGLLLLVRSDAAARVRVARVVEVAAVVVEVAAVVVEAAAGVVVGAAVEEVATVGLVEGVGALVTAVEAAEGVAALVAVGLVAVGLALGALVLEVASVSSSTIRARPSRPSNFTCGRLHTQHRCFSRLDVAWRAEFGDDVELTRWADLLRSRIAIFDLDFDDVLFAMYALSVSAEGDCYRCVPPDLSIAAAALGASEFVPLPSRMRWSLPPLPCLNLHLHMDGASPGHVHSSARVESSLLWHHRLGHLSLPCLRGMHSRLLVSGLPRSLPPLPPSPALPCLPCVEGRQRAAPHSSSFPLTTAPLQTLHMDVWGPACVSGQSSERYYLLVVDDYTQYTMVFPLRSKGQVVDVLIPWIRTVRLQLRERFGQNLPVLHLHSHRGGEFSSTLLRDFSCGEGILQSFTLTDSPQQNEIAEHRIGLVMEVARTSMIHAAAPHFLWPFAVRYYAHQLNLWPRVSLPETSPTLRWMGEVGDALVFRVWGSRAFVRNTSSDKLSPRAIPCVFLGFVPDAPGWQFYHPPSRRVFPSQDVTFDELVPFYRLFPYCSVPPPPPPLFLAPGPPLVDPLPPKGPAPSGCAASGGAEPGGAECEGAGSGGAEPEDEEPGGAEPVGVEPKGAESAGAESEGAESGGAEPWGAASSGGPTGASPRLSPQQLREWFVRRARLRSGATGAGGTGDAGAGGAGVTAGAGGTGGTASAGPIGARTKGTRAAGTGGVEGAGAGDPTEPGAARAGGTGARGFGAAGAEAVDPRARSAGDTVQPRPYFVPLHQQVLGVPSSTGPTPPLLCPLLDQSQLPLQPASPLPAPSPYTEQSGCLTERREPASRPVSPVRTARHIPRSHPPPVPGTHAMALRPSSVPMHVPLPAPPESSLLEVPEPESDRACAASPTDARLLATTVTDPSFESATASALVAELAEFVAVFCVDYASALVAESGTPPSIRGECALGTDVLEDRQEEFQCLVAAVPRFASMLLAPEGDPDAPDIPTPRSYAEAITGTYVDEVPPPGANIVDGLWIFRRVDYFQTFSPTPKMTTLQVLLPVAPQRDYKLHSLDFSTAFLQGSLHEEIWLRRPPGFTESFPAGTQWSLRWPVYGLRQAPREWHDRLRTTLAALGFAPATADPSLFLRTDTSLPPFYVLVYVDDLVFATADIEAVTLVKSELQKRHTCIDLGELRSYLGLQITRDRARHTITLTQSHMVHQVLQRFDFQFSLPQPTPLSTSRSLSAPP